MRMSSRRLPVTSTWGLALRVTSISRSHEGSASSWTAAGAGEVIACLPAAGEWSGRGDVALPHSDDRRGDDPGLRPADPPAGDPTVGQAGQERVEVGAQGLVGRHVLQSGGGSGGADSADPDLLAVDLHPDEMGVRRGRTRPEQECLRGPHLGAVHRVAELGEALGDGAHHEATLGARGGQPFESDDDVGRRPEVGGRIAARSNGRLGAIQVQGRIRPTDDAGLRRDRFRLGAQVVDGARVLASRGGHAVGG
jgi:hypothetical protein